MNKKYLLIAIIIILIALGGFYLWQKYYKISVSEQPEQPAAEAPKTLGEEIVGKTVTNPAETIPQTNPYEAKTNPFESAKTNPYSNVYTNPFSK